MGLGSCSMSRCRLRRVLMRSLRRIGLSSICRRSTSNSIRRWCVSPSRTTRPLSKRFALVCSPQENPASSLISCAQPVRPRLSRSRSSTEPRRQDCGSNSDRAKLQPSPRSGLRGASSTADPDPVPPAPLPVIVLDPGHGGADGGARGVGGAVEKTLVFEFCSELKQQLEATRRYSIALTRNRDEYVDLDDRVAMARNANASLFISVHADTLSEAADVSGSTVYTVAERPSDSEAARIAARENAADPKLGGEKQAQDDPGVADILFDLKRRETRAYAHIFSRGLVENLRGSARLNHNPERSAGFVVLKAPEFPSVLRRARLSIQRARRPSHEFSRLADENGGCDGQGDRRFLFRPGPSAGRRGRAGRRARRPAGKRSGTLTLAVAGGFALSAERREPVTSRSS